MDNVIQLLDYFGTAIFAITGAIAAGRKHMDVFGVVVLGCVTALGGGTLRDVLLDINPVFWIVRTEYLMIAVAAAIGTVLLACCVRLPAISLMCADALGLATFTVIGFERGFQATGSYGIATVMGVMTGVVGGILRDVLSGETPLIFRREIYASASLCGAALLALLTHLNLQSPFTITVAVLTTFAVRMLALHRDLSLPQFHL